MTYLFDTNAIGDLVVQLPGLSRSRTASALRSASAVLAKFTCVAVDPAVAEHYARIKVAMRRLGRGIGENDLWIAATAVALGAVLVSRDADARGVLGLTVEDWSV